MDQRALDSQLKALQKAVAERESPATIIGILDTLKKEVVPTEELLRVRALLTLRIPHEITLRSYILLTVYIDNQSRCPRLEAKGEPKQRHRKAGS